MAFTRTQRFMLYSLGLWFEEANDKIKEKPLKVSISKSLFIDLVNNAGFAEKQERALYKNLEVLEKKKLIIYQNKELELTSRGLKLFQEIKEDFSPYLNVYKKLKEKDPTSYTKKVQTVFK
jgi:hypothetical protein